jgi:hypothetical protein
LANEKACARRVAMEAVRLVLRETRLALGQLETHSCLGRAKARLAAFPTWADGIADHRFRYSAFPALVIACRALNLVAVLEVQFTDLLKIQLAAGLRGWISRSCASTLDAYSPTATLGQ